MIDKQLPRRTFLRGMGTAMSLPLLEAMLPSSALAAPDVKKAPQRIAFLFVPNGVHMQDWTPKTEGSLEELPFVLEPLKEIRHKVSVLTNLTHDKARPNGDGPGDHARSASAFLTASQPRKTAGADIHVGVSVDQVAAKHIGRNTRFASLELGCERGRLAGNCDSGYSCAYSNAISWQSPTTPVAKEVDPRLVFERLFGSGSKESAEARAKRERNRLSILDYVMDDAKQLQKQLGVKDQQKLDEYFTGVREIEKRIELAQQGQSTVSASGYTPPSGIPKDYAEHLRLMADMMVLAFQTDQTRVLTFMLANEGSNRPYPMLEIPDGHHDLSHHGGDKVKHDKIRRINRFHVETLAYALQKLDSIKEGDQTILDNSMIVYGCAISDGNRHNHDELPVLLAGRGGGWIDSGRHIVYQDETPMANLFVTMLNRAGVKTDAFGDSTGPLDMLDK
ncbi:MAG: DUF1552 domain-containing protein [Armatimonadota bacterium]